MTYLVTGATRFIGRHLVEQLLRNRDGDVHVVVREGSRAKLDALLEPWPHSERVKVLAGDLEKPRVAVGEAWVGEHRRRIEHVLTSPRSTT